MNTTFQQACAVLDRDQKADLRVKQIHVGDGVVVEYYIVYDVAHRLQVDRQLFETLGLKYNFVFRKLTFNGHVVDEVPVVEDGATYETVEHFTRDGKCTKCLTVHAPGQNPLCDK